MMHRPRKRFGQHFLSDISVIDELLYVIHPKKEDTLVEIGPGLGALTLPLLKKSSSLIAVELDRDLIPSLEKKCANEGVLTLYQADALTFDFRKLHDTQKLRIVGNLPYNISTALLFHLLERREVILDMHFMLQKEVADRLCALPGSKTYGRLSVMMQYAFEIAYLFTVNPSSFYPPPKVYSAVVRLIPKVSPLEIFDKKIFSDIVREAFQYRRKTLRKALSKYASSDANNTELWQKTGIDPTLRAEKLSFTDYVKIANTWFLLARKKENV